MNRCRLLIGLLGLSVCGCVSVSFTKTISYREDSSEMKMTFTPSSDVTENSSDNSDETSKTDSYYTTKALKVLVPDGWSTSDDVSEERYDVSGVTLTNGDFVIDINYIMRYPAGVGGDPYADEGMQIETQNNLLFYGGIVYETNSIWLYGSRLNSDQGFLVVKYTGNSEIHKNDSVFLQVIDSIELAGNYGTVTIKANVINVRDTEFDGTKIGSVHKGESYPVYDIQYPTAYNEYTHYNIGNGKFIADKDGEWVEFLPADNFKS